MCFVSVIVLLKQEYQMAYKEVINDVRKAVALLQPSRIPVFACSEEFDVKWHSKYTYEQVCQDGNKMAEVWIAAIEEFDYDWAWLQIDDCFEFEPLGVGCVGSGNILRATKDYLPATRATLERLKAVNPHKDGRMPEKLKAISLLRKHFGEDVIVVGSCAGPYSSVGLLVGLQEAMILGLTDQELLADFCEFFVELQSRYIRAQCQAGAHAIWLGDCNAFSAMLSVEQYREFAFSSCKKLVEKAKKENDVIIYLHNSEVQVPHLLAESELGVDIVSVGPAADILTVKTALTGRQCFSGNLDPIEVLMRGTPLQVAQETRRIMNICAAGGGYIFNAGEMNPRDVPVENMKAMIQAAKEV
jgi:MtaA/CmuA family methyltransferase